MFVKPNMSLDYFRLIGIVTCVSCVLTTLIGVGSFVHLQNSIVDLEQEILARQSAFRAKSQVIWAELVETGRSIRVPRNPYASAGGSAADEKRGVLHQCSQCTRLHCPQGAIGLEGPPGLDGQPGTPGKSGVPGKDGVDVELEPQDEMPCSICPAGPQGPRGAQGERGLSGKPGLVGRAGRPGKPGQAGGHGAMGARGATGIRGEPGRKGPPGDNVIAGEGVKGPPGLAGTRGPKGPPGSPGRPSNIRGPPGKPGEQGAIGATGKYGSFGEKGGIGPPGEPGLPATYCPSDCGVNKILSQIGMQPADSINGEAEAPAAYPETTPEIPSAQPIYEPESGDQEEFEETSYRNFFFSQ